MADNWSTSIATLAGQGDWIEWTVTLAAGEADFLNGAFISGSQMMAQVLLRYAKQASGDAIIAGVLINDFLYAGGPVNDSSSTGGWSSATRFVRNKLLLFSSSFNSISSFPSGSPVFSVSASANLAGEPWHDGTNTVRVINLGTDPIDIDFVMLGTRGPTDVLDTDSIAPAAPTGFSTHTNGTHIAASGGFIETSGLGYGNTNTWFLKAPDGTTGTLGSVTLTITKFCPRATTITIGVYVHDGTTPATGLVGAIPHNGGYDPANIVEYTLDGDGRATLTVDLGDYAQPSAIPGIWYGGDDNYGPDVVIDATVKCGGWHVGNIGIG